MQGSFKATFTGSKSDISLLTGYLEENYPELIDTMELPDDFDERPDDKKTRAVLGMVKAISTISLQRYMSRYAALSQPLKWKHI